jgi:hypothetical protein
VFFSQEWSTYFLVNYSSDGASFASYSKGLKTSKAFYDLNRLAQLIIYDESSSPSADVCLIDNDYPIET